MDKIQEYFIEFNSHLLSDNEPSVYFNELIGKGDFPEFAPFDILLKLKDIKQNEKYHPEGSVWAHTMLVVDEAAIVKEMSIDKDVFMWVALLHDIGKVTTTKIRHGRITSYDHDVAGAGMAKKFLEKCVKDKDFVESVAKYIYWHMQPLFVSKKLPFANLTKMSQEVSPAELALFSLCDRRGRGKLTSEKEKEEARHIKIFLNKCEDLVLSPEERNKIAFLKERLRNV